MDALEDRVVRLVNLVMTKSSHSISTNFLVFASREVHPQAPIFLLCFKIPRCPSPMCSPPHAKHFHVCTFSVGVEAAGILALALCGSEEERKACMLRIMFDAVLTKMATQYTRSTRDFRFLQLRKKQTTWLARVGILIDVSLPELMRSRPVSIRLWIGTGERDSHTTSKE